MTIVKNVLRNGNITSSQFYKLISTGKRDMDEEELKQHKKNFPKSKAKTIECWPGTAGLTYIKEKNFERKMKRSLSLDKYTHSTLWGLFLEQRVHNLLGLDYESVGHITLRHPKIDYWVGSPDNKNVSKSICGDTKCYEPKAFCEYVDILTAATEMENNKKGFGTEHFKKEAPQEYWQLISNSIILGMKNIEAIVYMPYYSELDDIAEMVDDMDPAFKWKYRFIYECIKDESRRIELPFLPDDSSYKNLNRFIFEVPKADKDMATQRAIQTGRRLDPR